MSSITVLTANPKVAQTKTIVVKEKQTGETTTEKQITTTGAKMSKFFSSREEPVSSFEDLTKIVQKLQDDQFSIVIRGCVKDGIDRTNHVRQKIRSMQQGTIEDVDQNWVCLDIDKKPLFVMGFEFEDVLNRPDEVVEAFKKDLPPCFSEAQCLYKFSSSAGVKDTSLISFHLWFWLDKPTSNTELKQYFDLYNNHMNTLYGVEKWVDPVLFDSIQPHYTANPVLIGLEDPLPKRCGILPGAPEVKISMDWQSVTPIDKFERWQEYLDKVGDDKDGFHGPLLSASASWVRKHGYSEKMNKEFIKAAKEQILLAYKSSDRTDEEINRYTSDKFLSELLRTAADKGMDKPGAIIATEEALNYFEDHTYVDTAAKFFNTKSKQWISKEAFDLVGVKFIGKSGSSAVFMASGGRVVQRIACLPDYPSNSVVEEKGIKTYNSWPGREVLPSDNPDGRPLEDHAHFLCDHRDTETNLLLDYIAHTLVNPGVKIKWAPLIGSEVQGTGKSMIKQLYRAILHPSMVTEIGTEDLKNNFNGYMFNTEMIFVEEVYTQNKMSITNKLKAMITEPDININIKMLPQFNVPNKINMVMFTNHRNALYMEANDRRIFVVYSLAAPKDFTYYANLVADFKSRPADYLAWAHARDLSKFNIDAAPVKTVEKAAAIAYSESAWKTQLREAHEGMEWPFQHDVVLGSELEEAIRTVIGKKISSQYVAEFYEALNVVTFHTRVRLNNGSRPKLRIIRNHEKYMGLTAPEVVKEIRPIGEKKEYFQTREF
jgi:hypothetical protein